MREETKSNDGKVEAVNVPLFRDERTSKHARRLVQKKSSQQSQSLISTLFSSSSLHTFSWSSVLLQELCDDAYLIESIEFMFSFSCLLFCCFFSLLSSSFFFDDLAYVWVCLDDYTA